MVNQKRLLILILILQACCTFVTATQAAEMVGRWEIEIDFTNGAKSSLRFDAQDAGRGSFLLVDSRSNLAEPATPAEAKWSKGDKDSVTFSGPVVFAIGNVGRDPGTLVFKGKFENATSITGEVSFFPLGQDSSSSDAKPTKTGTFKASRGVIK
jgi:hypothetical protein